MAALVVESEPIMFTSPDKKKVQLSVVAEGNLKLISSIKFESECLCCAFHQQGRLLAVGLANGIIKVYSIESKNLVYSLHDTTSKRSPVTCLKWKPKKNNQQYGYMLMSTYASGEFKRWHVTSNICLHTYSDPDQQLLVCAYNSNGNQSISAGSEGVINVYNEDVCKQIMTMKPSMNADVMDGHVMRLFALKYQPTNDNVFVSGGWDDTVQWWDARVSERYSVRKIHGPHVCGEGIDIEDSQMLVASWRKEKNLQLYDFRTGNLLRDVPADYSSSMLYCAQWQGCDRFLCGGSHSNMMRLVDNASTQTMGRLLNLPGAVFALDCNHVGQHPVIAVCSDRTVYLVEDTTI